MSGKESVKADGARAGMGKRTAARVLLLLSPLLLLGLLEAALRAWGYGYPSGYFRQAEGPGGPMLIGNPDFYRNFFPPRLEPYPEPISLRPKAPGAYRIFVLGESAALGIPDPSFGFPRILERQLHARYPGIRFEVLCLAVTAINSHVILPIARAAASQHPDLFILYMGNNEFIGPFGPGTVFAPFAAHPALIRASLALKSLRVGQWLDARLAGAPAATAAGGRPEKWAGLEMFLDHAVAAGDPRVETVYANFRSNLEGILDAASGAGAKTIVATVAVNRRDNAPFASRHRPGFSPADSSAWEGGKASAAEALAAGDTLSALHSWQGMLKRDSGFAEAHFQAGRLLLALGRSAEADSAFTRALDQDALRFRADSRINLGLRAAARARAGMGVWLADIDSLFRTRYADSGNPFYEHVHLRYDGNFRLAGDLLPLIDSALAASGMAHASPQSPVPSGATLSWELCRASLALTGWNELAMAGKILAMAERPPFTGRSDHALMVARLRQEVEILSGYTQNDQLELALSNYQQALAAHPDDPVLIRNFGEFFYACNYLPQAAEQFQTALALLPHDTRSRQMLAKCLAEQGDPQGAEREYLAALKWASAAVELRNGLATALATRGEHERALVEYRAALRTNPAWPEVHFNLARSLEALGRPREAIGELEIALKLDPALTPAARELDRLRGPSGAGPQ